MASRFSTLPRALKTETRAKSTFDPLQIESLWLRLYFRCFEIC
jgi:hypothetical protein